MEANKPLDIENGPVETIMPRQKNKSGYPISFMRFALQHSCSVGSDFKWPLEQQGFATAREETETMGAAIERPQLICIRFSR